MESLIHDAGMNGTRVDISIMAQLKQMNAIIHDLHIVSQVSTTINHMVSQIQLASDAADISSLTQTLAAVTGQCENTRSEWAVRAAQIQADTITVTRQLDDTRRDNDVLQRELDHITFQSRTLADAEAVINEKQRRKTAAQDISSLPKLVLRDLCMYLDKADVAHAAIACQRWCFTLDRGYLWKALLSREVQRAEMARRREAASRLHVALPPKSVSIALNGVQQKGVPNKDVIFALCQKSIQKQVMQASSEREDLSSKANADREVKKFLRAQLTDACHQLGLAHCERGDWIIEREKIGQIKNAMDLSMQKLERRIAKEKQRRALIKQQTDESVNHIEQKIKVIQNAKAYESHTAGEEDGPSTDEIKSGVAKLKKQKKILVKGVRQLRADLTQLHQERDQYATQLTALQAKLDALLS